jgi:hypothetical protein
MMARRIFWTNIGQEAFFRGRIEGFKVGSLLDGQDGGVGPPPGEFPGDDEADYETWRIQKTATTTSRMNSGATECTVR